MTTKSKMNLLVDDIIDKLDCEDNNNASEDSYGQFENDYEEDRRNDEIFFQKAKKRVSF
jgi:hypothetical protein